MANKDRARGHALELHVGRLFGGRRRTNGERGGFDDCVPIEGGQLPVSIEAKAYAKLQLQTKWINQAVKNSDGRPWAVVQRPLHSKRIYATVDLDFLIDLCKKAGLIPHQTEERNAANGERTDGKRIDPGSTDSSLDRELGFCPS